MTGIPVYTQVNATKASGTTPQTTAPQPQTASSPNPAPSTTTASPTSSYPPARPGAAAVPAPTGAAQRYAPIQPTPTTKTDTDSPAAPQPGAMPTPLGSSSIPPPPKVGQTYHPPQQTAAPTQPIAQPYPPQMSIPPPTSAYGAQMPHSSTTTTTAPLGSYPASIPEAGAQRRSLEHPPGYQQNQYASEMTSDQRRAHEAANYSSTSQENKETIAGIDTESVWNTARSWLGQAGEKISAAEAEVWRKINKE
ncbi:hypothetical protein BDZ45DRAFT_54591 [Acephala macrosclerotiorum]|nr:hypothetical protein BDZ45DRAFT_54591 [Acephala macrosclerotiorum]